MTNYIRLSVVLSGDGEPSDIHREAIDALADVAHVSQDLGIVDLGRTLGAALPDAGVMHMKCGECHLFVEPNDVTGPQIAAYVHLSRGNAADERFEDHEAQPSTFVASLDTWRVFGPSAMRERFVTGNY